MIEEKKEEQDRDVFEGIDPLRNQSPVVEPSWVKLPQIDLLSVAEADQLLRWRPANLIAIIGERSGGKTTLITEIYERFLRGEFADQLFCYCETLQGFEKRSFPSRANSLLPLPKTTRTSKQDGLKFFHLALASAEDGKRVDLLISERAGETYSDARDRPAESLVLTELTKARTVAFIMDGERVVKDMTRAEAFASVRNMVRGFADARAIPKTAEVQLVTTKYDLLAAEAVETARDALSEFEVRFKRSYEARFARVSTWRTAARDPLGNYPPAWEVGPVLRSWLSPPPLPRPEDMPLPELSDEFDRLLLRRAMN